MGNLYSVYTKYNLTVVVMLRVLERFRRLTLKTPLLDIAIP